MRIQAIDLPEKLPLYLKSGFTFFKGELGGTLLAWVKITTQEDITPGKLSNRKSRLEQFFLIPVVFIFDRLDSWQRKRLIEKQIAFVETGRQVYIPELFLQLDDTRGGKPAEESSSKLLSFPGQMLVLYHLQQDHLDGQPAFQIAQDIGYSAMTVTRVIRELEKFRLIEVRTGKEKAFDFDNTGIALWKQASPFMRSPIKEIWYSETVNGLAGSLCEAGETALAQYSMLSGPRVKQYAIGKEHFRTLRAKGRLPELDSRHGKYRIEVWHYNPSDLVEQKAHVVDRLSLYLSLRGSLDERIMAALEEAIKDVPW